MPGGRRWVSREEVGGGQGYHQPLCGRLLKVQQARIILEGCNAAASIMPGLLMLRLLAYLPNPTWLAAKQAVRGASPVIMTSWWLESYSALSAGALSSLRGHCEGMGGEGRCHGEGQQQLGHGNFVF